MKTYEILITVGNSLSLCGACVIFFLFFHFEKLRQGFFSHIIIYITIGSLIQIIGIQLSASFGLSICKLSVCILIYGSLIMIFWSTIMIWALKQSSQSILENYLMYILIKELYNNQKTCMNNSEKMN
ncbi:unnamed protein product [Paramecium sonneborni]|uniref:Uncharacterized protein n=1 Tax=Paramecium sonneborni TaxID=65129 RepID=A0A8S1R6Z2_9CILI|nr:unnamed protein product [Paramecium sonneborni]